MKKLLLSLAVAVAVVGISRLMLRSRPPDCRPTAELRSLALRGQLTGEEVACLEDRALLEVDALELLVVQAFLTNRTRWAALLERLSARTDNANHHYKLALHYRDEGLDSAVRRHVEAARMETWVDASEEQITLRRNALDLLVAP